MKAHYVKYVIVAIVSIIALIILVRVLGILHVLSIFWWVEDDVIDETGMNPYLAKSLAIFLTIVFIYAIDKIFSFSKQQRLIGYGVIAATYIVFNLGMYFYTGTEFQSFRPNKNTRFFNPKGKPLIYYYQSADGNIT